MEKLDLRKELKAFYSPSAKKIEIIDVPRFQFIMLDGKIESGSEPGNSPAFQQAMEAMYGTAYTLKFMVKLRENNPIDFSVMALEGLWSFTDVDLKDFRKDNLSYTLIMMQPDFITSEMFNEAMQQVRKKKGDLPALSLLRLESFQEGLSIQTMHVGAYDTEPATIEKMNTYAHENGYQMQGRHHEIYLGDPLRSQPEKLKTILRHPVILQS